MTPFLTTLKATVGRARLLLGRNHARIRHQDMGNHLPVRCSTSIPPIVIDSYSFPNQFQQQPRFRSYPLGIGFSANQILQRRSFLGCGDGEEGSALSKIHEENLVLGYSPEQLFAVVEAVDMYEDFLPWCQRSDIVRRYPDGSFEAELEIGFKFLVESYISHVVIEKPKLIKTTASQSNLFEHLINLWEFRPGPTPGTSNVYFMVDFKFRSPLYRQVASMFFKEVVSQLVNSFTDRCRLIYGPGTQIIQKN